MGVDLADNLCGFPKAQHAAGWYNFDPGFGPDGMNEEKGEQPIEQIIALADQAVRVETEPAPVRRYRAFLFQTALVLAAGAFAAEGSGNLLTLTRHLPARPVLTDTVVPLALRSVQIEAGCAADYDLLLAVGGAS